MKKLYPILILCGLLLANCSDDYLDKSPISDVSTESFFRTAADLKLYTNGFYLMFPGTNIYSGDSECGNILDDSPSSLLLNTRTVPASGGGWSWENLRKINYFLENYDRCDDESAKKHYSGVAYFFRAYFYFNMVMSFGDVPWYDKTMEVDDENLYKARDNRSYVVDLILEDLDLAITNLKEEQNGYEVTRYTALALKSRVGLFEGTYEKYRNISGYEKYLQASVDASLDLMENSPYSLYSTGNPETDYGTLFNSNDAQTEEVILARAYKQALVFAHRLNYYTVTASYGRPGMPKDMVNSYLKTDGSRFTDQPDYNQIFFTEETADRDPRLAQTIRTPGYTRKGQSQEIPPDLSATITGYQLVKFVTEQENDGIERNINDLPVFRFGETLLNYAEAKAELGTLTQADLDISIKLLRERAGMPALKLADANAGPDLYLENFYPNVSGANKGVILEIRRERRVELYMENFRWPDIIRWKAGEAMMIPFRGIYLPGAGEYDMDGDGKVDWVLYEGNMPSTTIAGAKYYKLGADLVLSGENLIDPMSDYGDRTFDDKMYLQPIPTQELQLNPNLNQNPGW